MQLCMVFLDTLDERKIERDRGATFPVACQTLTYFGKILNDDEKFSDIQYDTKRFIYIPVAQNVSRLC